MVCKKSCNKFYIIALIVVSIFAIVVGAGVADVADPYADEVYSFTQGYVWDTTKAEPPGTWGYTDAAEETLGGPKKEAASGNAYFVSLGSRPAGEIILKFTDYVLIDGDTNAGYDLAIYEFGAADHAHIYLSNDYDEDGQPDGWVYLGYTEDDAEVTREVGNHPDSIASDSSSVLFLLDVAGKLDSIGGWASFIRIVDDDTGRKDPNFTDGFDLNAVELLNYVSIDDVNQPPDEETPPDDGDSNEPDTGEPDGNCPSCGNNYNNCNYGCGGQNTGSTSSNGCGNTGGSWWSWTNTDSNNSGCNCGNSNTWSYGYTNWNSNYTKKSWWQFDWGSCWNKYWN